MDTTRGTVRESARRGGITAGGGILLWGQQLDYAWLPRGELGDIQYFSLLMRFGRRDPRAQASAPARPAEAPPAPEEKSPAQAPNERQPYQGQELPRFPPLIWVQ